MQWRFVPFQYYNPYFKTGLNQALLESVGKDGDRVVFLSGWKPNCVNIGRSQDIEERVDMEEVEKRDIVIVRRQGGGGTTYLTEGGEITWGIVAPEKYFADDVNQVYREICGVIADSLSSLGIEAEHETINDVVTDGRKISGATLKRKSGAAYVGGTLLYEVDVDEMFSVLTPDEDKLEDKQVEEFRERVTSVSRESCASFDETKKALKQGLLKDKEWRESGWTEFEKKRAEELADKYSSDKWLYRE